MTPLNFETRALVFPGQGSQHVGMAASFMAHPLTKTLFTQADDVLGFSLSALMEGGDAAELTQTENTQPALFTAGMAVVKYLEAQSGAKVETLVSAIAGHSVGEFAAACAAGVFSFEEGLKLVRARGEAMAKAVPLGEGSMAAVLGLKPEDIDVICVEHGAYVANDNSAGQVVISGLKAPVEAASAALKTAGAKLIVPLDVAGPFHTPLMQPAADTLATMLADMPLHTPRVPLAMVATAEMTEDVETVRQNLIQQTTSTVRWREVMGTLTDNGILTVQECGAGNVLTKLTKRHTAVLKGTSLTTVESCDAFLKELTL